MLARYVKEDGIIYCKHNDCETCKLKDQVCINESGQLRLKNHTEFTDFIDSYNTMTAEIAMNVITEKYRSEIQV